MKPERNPDDAVLADSIEPKRGLPGGYPEWAGELAELYFSGTTSTFVLHGNVYDPVASGESDAREFQPLAGFLAEEMFGTWDLVLHFDLAGGLRALAGSDAERLKEMVTLANRRFGDFQEIPKDPRRVFAFLDAVFRKNLMTREEEKRLSVAIVIDHASHLIPRGEPGHMNLVTSTSLVTVLNWATSPYIKRLNMAVLLVDPKVSALNERLTGNPHVATIEITLPEEPARREFVSHLATDGAGGKELSSFSDYDEGELAKLTAGVSLADIETLIRATRQSGRRLDAELFRALKKRLLERQCEGFLEFIEPSWDLDMVVGHESAKQRLRDDAALLRAGHLQTVPMGYLLCGSVGTGKSFLAQCAAGSLGVPCVMLKNFRSKYVGETEGNLQKVLSVLRAMGPVVVIVDEADAMLGDRDQGGDSGTSSRVFAMIAAQMGNTRYRGRILWMLLTCRPDLLPIDLKRQGRAEVHIPLFYPVEEEELRDMFVVLAKKLGATLAPEDVPEIPHAGDLSGADIEGIVGRAQRTAIIAGQDRIRREDLAEAVARFMPSTESLERELQETAAIIECTDRQFLPPHIEHRIEEAGGRPKLQERLTTLKHLVDSM